MGIKARKNKDDDHKDHASGVAGKEVRDRPQLKYIPLRQLKTHPLIQRDFKQYIANRIIKNFDPALLGELRVVADGKFYLVFDGQHRVSACKEYLKDEDQTVPCMVYDELTPGRLASICRGINSSVAWRAIDNFQLRVMEGERQAVEIHSILREFGMRVDSSPRKQGTIQAVNALDWVYQHCGGSTAVKSVIGILVSAFQKESGTFDNSIMRGLGLFLTIYPHADRSILANRMRGSGGPVKLIGEARDRSRLDGCNTYRGMAVALCNIYNKGRSPSGRLQRPSF